MPNRSLTIEQVLTMLQETPPRSAALTASLRPDQLHVTPNPGEWSANEVLATQSLSTVTLAQDTGSSNLIARTHITRRRQTWRGIEPWPS